MAEKIVSPGVFTNERDLSFLPSGVAQIGAAIVGPTTQGPAFVPKLIQNFDQFIAWYGDTNENYYVPYAVKSYLKSAGSVTVVRVVSEGGYSTAGIAITSGSDKKIYGLLLPTTTVGSSTGNDFSKTTINNAVGSASLIVSGANVTGESASFSFAGTASDSIAKVFGTSVFGPKKEYAYIWFQEAVTANAASVFTFFSGSFTQGSGSLNLSGSVYGAYQPAATGMVTSQLIGASKTTTDLFKIYTLSDGAASNQDIKVSIINNALPGTLPGTDYGTFTLLVRDFTDTDQRPTVLETYSNLNLDPDSPNFVSRRIGDRAYAVDSTGLVTGTGDYDNISKYIRVSATNAVKTKAASPSLITWGHAAYVETVVMPGHALPTASLVTSSPVINGAYNTKAYYGLDFTKADTLNYLKPLPSGALPQSNSVFNLDNCLISGDYGTANDSNSAFTAGTAVSGATLRGADIQNIAKFTMGFQGGFDGMDPAIPIKTGASILSTNTVGLDCSGVNSIGTLGYKKALNVLSNAESYDVNLLAIPGIVADTAYHLQVATKAIEVAEDRGDCFVILDPTIQGATIGTAVSAIANSGINTSYAATYWPWVKIMDVNRMKPIWVPPSVVLPRVIAQSDTAAFEWFAPAGLNRGGIQDAVDVEAKLSFSQRDTLYEARINPLATFPAQGVCVWGQKTLQTKASALDRINVRRLMITLKKFIASSSRYLVFENNTNETRQRFINIVTPYLENVKARQGLYAFRVVMDETNNTPDVIDRNQLYGQIFLQPAKTAEFIVLDFNILPTGATFDNA